MCFVGVSRTNPQLKNLDTSIIINQEVIRIIARKESVPKIMNVYIGYRDLPEGDYGLYGITHQIYFIPSNKPVSVMEPVKPDKKTSRFFADKDGGTLYIREDNSNKEYVVPAELIPEIREKARQLCQNPVEAYVENGSWESFVEFGEGGGEFK